MPDIRAQNDFLREPPSGWGAFNPGFPGFAALYEALPLAFSPPLGFLPSLRVHAGVLAIEHRYSHSCWSCCINTTAAKNAFAGDYDVYCA